MVLFLHLVFIHLRSRFGSCFRNCWIVSWLSYQFSEILISKPFLISGTFDLWLNIAEPYLDTTWGAGVNLIDSTIHYALYLLLIKRQLEGRRYDFLGE